MAHLLGHANLGHQRSHRLHGLKVVAESIDKLVDPIPNLIGSVLILTLALFLASVRGSVVVTPHRTPASSRSR